MIVNTDLDLNIHVKMLYWNWLVKCYNQEMKINIVQGFFLDLSKAFDTLDHHLLLQKMVKYGIRGLTLDWLKSYLSNRTILAKITD